jgi:hypothetical protein
MLARLEMLLRRGLVAVPLFLGLLGLAAAAACGASSNSGFGGSGEDSGSGDSSAPPPDTGPIEDSGSGQDAPSSSDSGHDAGPPITPIIFLHASRSLPSVRLCFMGGGSESAPPFPSANEMPSSNYPGIPKGGAVWVPDPSAIPTNASVFAVSAKFLTMANIPLTTPCGMLICPPGQAQNCLMQGSAYWPVGSITRAAALPDATTVFAISGCQGISQDSLASVERCGTGWNAATGNLHIEVVTLPATAQTDAGLIVQATQLSPGLVSLQGDAGTTSLSFGSMADAQPPVQLSAEGTVVTFPLPLTVPPGLAGYGQVGFAVDVEGADAGPAGQLWMSLAQAQELVDPAQDPTVYYAGGSYVVAVVGDPAAPHAFEDGDGGYDGTGLHVLVLPTTVAMP